MEWADCYDDAMSESVERYIKFREEQKKELAMRWLSDYTDMEKTTSASGPMRRTSARIHRNYPSLVIHIKESDIPGSIAEEVTEEVTEDVFIRHSNISSINFSKVKPAGRHSNYKTFVVVFEPDEKVVKTLLTPRNDESQEIVQHLLKIKDVYKVQGENLILTKLCDSLKKVISNQQFIPASTRWTGTKGWSYAIYSYYGMTHEINLYCEIDEKIYENTWKKTFPRAFS